MIGAYRVKASKYEVAGIGAIMNRKDRCPECSGGGLMPALGCTCDGNAHICIPAVCTVCHGTGSTIKV